MLTPRFTWSFKDTAPGPAWKGESSFSTGLFINNEWVPSSDEKTIDILNPSTGKVVGHVSAANEKDVDIAVAAAQKAFTTTWGLHKSGAERGRLMNKLADLIDENAEELAALETLDSGLSIIFTTFVTVKFVAGAIRYYAGFADKNHGKTVEVNESKFAYTRVEPIGVVGAITPWNVPLIIASMKLGPALATGNTVVFKPSELAPLTSIRLGGLIKEAGFPPGVVNIVTGYGNTAGEAIANHMGIGKISFTGSTVVGRHIMKAASQSNLKRVSLELGGKSPTVVLPDADIEESAKWAAFGIMNAQGQTCSAGSRVYVHESIHEKFVETLMGIIKGIKVGDPFTPTNFYGPQVSQKQFERVTSYIDVGKKEGATLLTGGSGIEGDGFFVQPTVFCDVTSDMRIVQEEIFGPVVVVAKYANDDDLIQLANGTVYGLAASIFGKDIARITEVSNKLQAGTIWVNSHSVWEWALPFGGYKQSGIGRDLGEDGLKEYLEVKAVHINLSMKAPI